MSGEWNYNNYLLDRLSSGISIQRNEKSILEDIEKYVGGTIKRSDAQQLKVKLSSARGIRQLLECKSQKENLLKIRIYERRKKYVEQVHVNQEKGQTKQTMLPTLERSFQVPKKVFMDGTSARKSVKNLTNAGKRFRRKNILKSLQEGESTLVNNKQKINAFQALNYQRSAHMSERDLEKTSKLIDSQAGLKLLPGRRLRKKAKNETVPKDITYDDFNCEISLQNGLEKTAQRLLNSQLIEDEEKKVLKSEKECTLFIKSGQDGTSGFNLCNKKTKRGSAKHQVAFVPLQVRRKDGKTLVWKNPKPNSNRNTKLLKSTWAIETTDYIVKSHEALQGEIENLQPSKILMEGVEIQVNYEVRNCMNDGKARKVQKTGI